MTHRCVALTTTWRLYAYSFLLTIDMTPTEIISLFLDDLVSFIFSKNRQFLIDERRATHSFDEWSKLVLKCRTQEFLFVICHWPFIRTNEDTPWKPRDAIFSTAIRRVHLGGWSVIKSLRLPFPTKLLINARWSLFFDDTLLFVTQSLNKNWLKNILSLLWSSINFVVKEYPVWTTTRP